MAADIIRKPRDHPQQSNELYRWAMLRIAVNEDKCSALTSQSKKHKKRRRPKEANEPWSSLFRNLPTLTTVRKWRAMVGGDVRRKYGGRTEWDSCLTDSAYLMYGIPRAKLRPGLVNGTEGPGRQNGAGFASKSVNYSQSFSSFDAQNQPRYVAHLQRIPSSLSIDDRSSRLTVPSSMTPSNDSDSPPAPVRPSRNRPPNPMPKSKEQTRTNEMWRPTSQTNGNSNGIVETPKRVNYSQSFSAFNGHQNPTQRVVQMSRLAPLNPPLTKSTAPISPASRSKPPLAAPVPPAPAIPIRNRPPHPMPKPKKSGNGHGPASNKYNLSSLQVALMGSLNKRLKAHSSNHHSES